ncbi:MAG: DUF488 domain-containing protein [Chloroflexi bacterium]|nr:DUF488 domain-containing protein [Chloroflexota bacterium]
MLRRQKTLLALLAAAKGPVSRTALVKYAFLLRHETCLRGDPVFYDFVPYKFGPFSFSMYRELECLQRDGWLTMGEEGAPVCLTQAARISRPSAWVSNEEMAAIGHVLGKYERLSRRELLSSVYGRYPWYASKSELADLQCTPPAPLPQASPAVYTVGYESLSVDSFFKRLLRKGIRAIADVRSNPVSRKYGFARKSLGEISAKLGLRYHHLPELGIPPDERRTLDGPESYVRLLDSYEAHNLPRLGTEILRLGRLLEAQPCVIMCAEKDFRMCHRGRLATAVSGITGLPIVHL